MFKTQQDYAAFVARRARDWEAAKSDTDAQTVRRVRHNLVAAALREAVNQAPDAFGDCDIERMAAHVCDLLEGNR
jgi:hypothetical protein